MSDPETHIPLPLLILTPLESEADALIQGLSSVLGAPSRDSLDGISDFQGRVLVRYLGAGESPADSLPSWLSSRSFGTVILSGFAGGISPGLTTGRLFVLGRICREGRQTLEFPEVHWWAVNLGMTIGEAVQVGQIVTFPEEKKRLYERTRADIVDMESHSWMEAIRKTGVNGIVIRVVSDTSDDALPAELDAFAGPDGRMQLFSGLGALFRKPAALARFLWILPSLLRARKTLVSLGRKLGMIVREGGTV